MRPLHATLLALAILVLPSRCRSAEALGSFLQAVDLAKVEVVLRAEGFQTREDLLAARLSVGDMKELGLGMKQRKKLG